MSVLNVLVSTHYAEDNRGRAEVYFSETAHYIKYYDAKNRLMYVEDFPGKTLHEVRMVAKDWV